MRKLTFPLEPGAAGAAVGDLHRVLRALDYEVAAPELAEQGFGPTTRDAVAALQSGHRLPPTGGVDRATAELLMRLWSALVLRTADRPADQEGRGPKTSTGTLLHVLGIARAERDVQLADLAREIAGQASPESVTPRSFLLGLLRARGHDAVADDLDSGDDPRFVVSGAIDRDGPLEGVAVSVVAVSLGAKPQVLARTSTNADGEFTVRYDADGNTVVRVAFEDSKTKRRLHISAPQRATRHSWVDWSSANQPVPRPGTFELRDALLSAALAPAKRQLVDLDESREQLDVTLLAETTGVSRAYVAMHAIAARLAADLGVPRALIFAVLGRTLSSAPWSPPPDAPGRGAPQGPAENMLEELRQDAAGGRLSARMLRLARQLLLGADEGAVRSAVAHATRSGQISGRIERDLDRSLEHLGRARRAAALDDRPGPSVSTWRQVLEAAGVPEARMDEAAARLLEHPAGDQLWSSLAGTAGDEPQRTEQALRLASLLDFDAVALKRLRTRGIDDGRALARTPDRDLHALLEEAFAGQADGGLSAARVEQRLDAAFPGDTLVRRVADTLDAATLEFLATPDGRARDLLSLNVEGLYRANRLAADGKLAQTVRASLLRLQRVGRVARDGRIAAGLLARGFESAAAIAFRDRRHFVEDARAIAGERELRLVHRRARAHYRATLNAFLTLNQSASGPALAVLSSPAEAVDMAAIANASTWEFLFGSPDFCDCEQCASVTSPAAYLVDLLIWLQRAPGAAPKPYDVLIDRRPDLIKILLNCANTNTLVPYIDLVCELLEEAVAIRVDAAQNPGAPLLTGAILAQRRRQRQTTLAADEIRAYPEHLDASVYSGVLQQYADRFVVPFDLAAEETRAYLALRSVRRGELMAIFGTGTPIERAAERLALVPAERMLIATPAAAQVAQRAQWGFDGPTAPLEEYLRTAPGLTSMRPHLSYDQLLSVLECGFPNPLRQQPLQAVAVELEPGVTADLCRSTDRQVVRLTLDALDRQHRFLRLARHLPWHVAEIDLLIASVGAGTLGNDCLIALGGVADIVDMLGLTPEETAYLFADFAAADAAPGATFADRPPLYARLFLSRTDGGGPPAVFRDPAAAATPLTTERARISGALGLSASEFNELLSGTALAAAPVSFAALSTLYRHARLAQATGLAIADFEVLRARSIDPFTSPANVLSFAANAALVRGGAIGGDALAVLTGATAATPPDPAPLVSALDALYQSTAAQIALDTGAPPARADVLAEIAARRSWTTAVTAWLEIDSRFAALLAALDAAVGPGQVMIDLFTNPPPPATLEMAARLATFVGALRVPPGSAEAAASLPGVLDTIRQPAWTSLANAVRFNTLLSGAVSPGDFVDFLRAIPDNTITRPGLAARLAAALGAETPAIDAAWQALFGNAVDRNALQTGAHYAVLRRVMDLSRTLGLDPNALKGLAVAWPGPVEALAARNAVRAVMPRADWLKASATVQNVLREMRRDALVAYLLATAGPNDARTAADLSGHFLIDVEMDDCMNTSRIVQANAAVQRYVQRCFLGLEDIGADQLGTDHWKQWNWRHRYRLWEANRLVFLYPENFLNVARRSNASALFGDLMKEVRQGDASMDSIRSALDSYLAGLERIGNLEYAAVSANLQNDPGFAPQLHLVARSRGTPQKHYHRKLAGGVWSPWEELAIGTPGRHLALLYRDGTTTLLWPTFADHPDPRQQIPAAAEGPAQEPPPSSGVSYLSYAWVTKDRKAWTPIQTSARALLHRKRARRPFLTALRPQSAGMMLSIYAPHAPATASNASQPIAVPQLGGIGLERDIISVSAFHDQRGLSSWLGGDHQPHLDATRVFEPAWCTLGADCNCLVMMSSSFVPWAGLSFDDNMMVSGLQTSALSVGVETANPLTRTTVRVVDSRSFSVAVDAATARWTSEGVSKSGFDKYTAYVIWDMVFDFGVDTFAFNDSRRSFLCLSQGAVNALAPGTMVPAGARFVLLPGYHPFVSDLRAVVHRYDDGLDRLFSAATQEHLANIERPALGFTAAYGDHTPGVTFAQPSEVLDFEPLSPYGLYNWELFFHAPLFGAELLRGNLRFEEARALYHYIFTPFTAEPADPLRPKARYWITKPFRQMPDVASDIRDILTDGAIHHTNPYADIEAHPFDAQLVAQTRPGAYQKHVVMRYLDNLIGWGDSLYRLGQREDVYDAIEIYELANRILGDRPEKLRPLGVRRDRAFEDENWSGGGNALVDLEAIIESVDPEPEEIGDAPLVELPLVPGLYFCVPPNRKLLKYWDDLALRLYNIRHCLTIDGQPVEYDLLAAPIDVQALADAAAAGVSVAEALAMAGSMLPPYRYRTIWSKAQEACADVRALGGALLAVLEKRDAEQLALLRSLWEGRILETTRTTREKQREQADSEVESLRQNRKTLQARRDHYRELQPINDLESAAFGLSAAAAALDTVGFVFDVLGGVLYLIPNVNLGVSGFGGTPQAGANVGGENIGNSTARTSQGLSRLAGLLDRAGTMVTIQASYARRKEEWDNQAREASAEIDVVDKQIAAARLRAEVAVAELNGHALQEKSWAEIDAVLTEKFTNEERYASMIELLRDLYQQAFQHAVKLAKLARECLAFETAPGVHVPAIGQTHWDSLQHGLLAGERLAADLRELDAIFTTQPTHAREVTQHVPLSQVAPDALIALRRTGRCTFKIPRWWFQRFDPGLINRRVRTLSVSMPSVTGPYVGINATLSVQGPLRTRASISLSTGINDFGVDVGANGDKYMPFEGLSLEAETTWTLGFPQDPNDPTRIVTDVAPAAIADVILHVQYTADAGAAALDGPPALLAFVDLRQMAADAWNQLVSSATHQATVRVTDLVPGFLAGYRVDAIADAVALLRDGTASTSKFTFALGAGPAAGTLTVSLKAGEVMDWQELSRVYIVASMIK